MEIERQRGLGWRDAQLSAEHMAITKALDQPLSLSQIIDRVWSDHTLMLRKQETLT